MLRVLLLALAVSCALALPTNFDARSKWGHKCQYNILNQGGCGSCWDFASSESFADRLCITGEAKNGTIISPQLVLDCIEKGSCNGGAPAHAWSFFQSSGDTTCRDTCKDGCIRYQARDDLPCPGHCDNGNNFPRTYHAGGFQGSFSSMNAAMTELYNNGPVQGGFGVYKNFSPFFKQNPTGIYDTTNGTDHVGSHAVKCIGWGHEDGKDYWLLANSWGSNFADHGYFKMLRGANLCGIDGMAAGFTKQQAATNGYTGKFEETPDRPLDGAKVVQDASKEWIVDVAVLGTRLLGERLGREVELVKVVSAQTQVVNGYKFYLSIVVKEEGKEKTVDLVILQDMYSDYYLE